MLEVNMRVFFPKGDTGFFPDYRRHMEMIRKELKAKVVACMHGRDEAQIYQYYSISPLGYVETCWLRRMGIGKSIVCIKEGIADFTEEYSRRRHIPVIFKNAMGEYLKRYLNLFDYIVVEDFCVAKTLRQEGVNRPKICRISPETGTQEEAAFMWLRLYRKCLAGTV